MGDFRLQVFIKVAKRLDLAQAAQELGVSGPAVDKNIRDLESRYGTRLLDRSEGRIGLTPAGRLFLIHAEKIQDHYGALEAEMYRISDNYCGELRVSADSSVVDSSLFSLFLGYCKRYSCIKVSYIGASGRSTKELLFNNEIDMAFTNGPYPKQDLHYTPYSKQKWVFVAYAKGVFADTDRVTLDQIVEYKLNINIFRSQAEYDYDYNVLLQYNRFMNYFSDLEVIKHLMFKNDCIGLLPLYAVGQQIADGDLKVIDVDGMSFNEEVGVLTRLGETNHAVQWFLDFVQESRR